MTGRPDISGALAAALSECGPFEPQPVIAVGVSGGGDSLALLLLLHQWVISTGGRVVALTVDHGLRPGAADEIAHVRNICSDLGVEHQQLVWCHDGISSGLQEKARRARYDLMTGWCRQAGILHLAVAHTADDQAETQHMRAMRSPSGPGIAGMPLVRLEQGVRLIRPLLRIKGTQLRDELRRRSVIWMEDPTNQDEHYERVRLRRSGQDLTVQASGQPDRNVLDRQITSLAAEVCEISPAGYASVDHAAARQGGDVMVSLMANLMRTVSGSAFAVARMKIAAHLMQLSNHPQRHFSLGGCLLMAAGERLLIVREYQRSEAVLLKTAVESGWDGRFCIQSDGSAGDDAVIAAAVGSGKTLRPIAAETGLPVAVIRGLPAVFLQGELVGLASLIGHQSSRTGVVAQFAPKNPLIPSARWLVPQP